MLNQTNPTDNHVLAKDLLDDGPPPTAPLVDYHTEQPQPDSTTTEFPPSSSISDATAIDTSVSDSEEEEPQPYPTTEATDTFDETSILNTNQQQKVKKAMEINDAYEALEKMRRLNLEVHCQECGIPPHEIDYEECTVCLLEGALALRAQTMPGKVHQFCKLKSHKVPKRMPSRVHSFVQDREEKRKPHRCLTCGAPSCRRHSSKTFRKEQICVCLECEAIFSPEYLVECLTLEGKERQAHIDKMMDLYDRATLLLKFSNQYIDEVIECLSNVKKRNNRINFTGSSAGIASGILGIAAAATIVTPAGVPLLIVSLMLGSAASASQAGTEVTSKYFSEPGKVADRILALHGMTLSILSITGALRDAATRDIVRSDVCTENHMRMLEDLRINHVDNRTQLVMGVSASKFATQGAMIGLAEVGSVARGARQMSRSGVHILGGSLRFATIAGGALAGATLLLEAKNMAVTVKSIREGSPCEKANALEKIKEELPHLPPTTNLDRESAAYLAYMEQRGQTMTQEEAVQLLGEVVQDPVTEAERSLGSSEVGGSEAEIVFAGEDDGTPVMDQWPVDLTPTNQRGLSAKMKNMNPFKRSKESTSAEEVLNADLDSIDVVSSSKRPGPMDHFRSFRRGVANNSNENNVREESADVEFESLSSLPPRPGPSAAQNSKGPNMLERIRSSRASKTTAAGGDHSNRDDDYDDDLGSPSMGGAGNRMMERLRSGNAFRRQGSNRSNNSDGNQREGFGARMFGRPRTSSGSLHGPSAPSAPSPNQHDHATTGSTRWQALKLSDKR